MYDIHIKIEPIEDETVDPPIKDKPIKEEMVSKYRNIFLIWA